MLAAACKKKATLRRFQTNVVARLIAVIVLSPLVVSYTVIFRTALEIVLWKFLPINPTLIFQSPLEKMPIRSAMSFATLSLDSTKKPSCSLKRLSGH